jgi:Outer membrane protein beta-barrel domain
MTTCASAPRTAYRHSRTRVGCVRGTPSQVLVLVWCLVAIPLAARAQDRPVVAIDVSAGALTFVDDGDPSEAMVGGAARWYVADRISIGPEFQYVEGDAHHHTVVTANVVWDVVPDRRRRGVTPFVVAGAGAFQTHRRFDDRTYDSREAAFTAGGGIRIRVSPRLRLGAEVRVGRVWHVRASGFVGVALGR